MISRDELIERIEAHGHDKYLTPDEVRNDFGEITKMLVPPGARLEPHAHSCCTTTGENISLRVFGHIAINQEYVGLIERCLNLSKGFADHEMFSLEHDYKNRGYAPFSLWQTIDLYDSIGIDRIYLQAGLATGRHYWAKYGFDFRYEDEREFVREWFADVLDELGYTSLSRDLHSAYALNGVGASSDARVSIREVETAILERGLLEDNGYLEQKWPESADRWDPATTAEQNRIDIHEPIELGKAMFLLLPIDWNGKLDLSSGPQREVFRANLLQRLREFQ